MDCKKPEGLCVCWCKPQEPLPDPREDHNKAVADGYYRAVVRIASLEEQATMSAAKIAALESALAKAEEALEGAPCRWLSEYKQSNCMKFGLCPRCAALAAIKETKK